VTVGFRFTSADLDRMPDIPGVRYEIIDGELNVTHVPNNDHQYVSAMLISALAVWSAATGRGATFVAPGLVFNEENEVIPDVVWASHERRAAGTDERGHFKLAPELIVEVLSPGKAHEVRDRELKLQLYSREGAQEYWLVDPREQLVDVYRRQGGELKLSFAEGDVLTSPLLPDFSCPLAALWPPPLRGTRA